jgi:hypothetical protein
LITQLNTDCETTKSNLTDISKEEDLMIEQLTIMEGSLDQLLSIADKNGVGSSDTDHVYNVANDISKTVDSVKKDIDEIDARILQTVKLNEDKLKTLTYETNKSRDKIYLDVLITF